MTCAKEIFGVCLIQASGDPGYSIFGFAEFVGALALLVIVFTIAGIVYRFRIAVAPIRLPRLTFYVIGIIGFGTLATEVWISEGWLVFPVPFMTQTVIQGLLGTAFILLALTWIYFAFINPPIFFKRNYEKYAQELFSAVLKGSDSELPAIAHELARSADAIVKHYCEQIRSRSGGEEKTDSNTKPEPTVSDYASDIMLLIGNRKLCRHIVASSPGTAIAFFDSATDHGIHELPLSQFAKNISTEALLNTDSILYHEDEGFYSGLLGYIKRFSHAIYGNYRLVEGLGSKFNSPLDIDYRILNAFNASQVEAYTRVVLITFEDYLRQGLWRQHSYTLRRAFDNVEHACGDVYKLDGVNDGDPDISDRLRIVVNFVDKVLDLIEKYPEVKPAALRPNDNIIDRDIYDQIAAFMLEIIFNASSVKSPQWPCWEIQHNTVWDGFFGHIKKSETRTIVLFKLRRMIYDEIRSLDKFVNFKSAALLGMCLNVMGVKISGRKIRVPSHAPIERAVISWTKKNYLNMRKQNKDVADACLMGGVSYDAKKKRIIRTYRKGLNKVAPQDILQL